MNLPTPHTVQHIRWEAGGTDAHGNPAPDYADPVDVQVYGWSFPAPEERTNQRVVVDVSLFGPPDLTVDSRDRFILPGLGLHEVAGPAQDYGNGPFGWKPGVVVNLVRVEG